jgi:hypothetical protein
VGAIGTSRGLQHRNASGQPQGLQDAPTRQNGELPNRVTAPTGQCGLGSTGCRHSSPDRRVAERQVPPAVHLRVCGRLPDQATTHVAGHATPRPETEPVRPLERSHGSGRQRLGHTPSVGRGLCDLQTLRVKSCSPGVCSVGMAVVLNWPGHHSAPTGLSSRRARPGTRGCPETRGSRSARRRSPPCPPRVDRHPRLSPPVDGRESVAGDLAAVDVQDLAGDERR